MRIDEEKLNKFLEIVLGDLAASYGGVMVSLGRKLGLYKTLAGAGPLTPGEVATRTGCAERYVREWLNSQAAAGYVVYHGVSGTYELPPERAMVLADEESPVYMTPAWDVPASMWFDEGRAIEAFRSGKGIPWGQHDDRLFHGVAGFYRNAYQGALVQSWIPAIAGLKDLLTRGARVADVGCGFGHSTIIMANAFPASRFYGFDVHAESVLAARSNAEKAGVAERVEFELANAVNYNGGPYDVVCFFDALHDMGDPVAAVRRAAEQLAPGGVVMAVEPFANDRVEDNLTPVGKLYYAASTMLCVAHSLSEPGAVALGAQAGPAKLEDVFRRAGFSSVNTALRTPFNLVLEARK